MFHGSHVMGNDRYQMIYLLHNYRDLPAHKLIVRVYVYCIVCYSNYLWMSLMILIVSHKGVGFGAGLETTP